MWIVSQNLSNLRTTAVNPSLPVIAGIPASEKAEQRCGGIGIGGQFQRGRTGAAAEVAPEFSPLLMPLRPGLPERAVAGGGLDVCGSDRLTHAPS